MKKLFAARVVWTAGISAALFAATVWAQQPAAQPAARAAGEQGQDHTTAQMAAWLIVGNNAEIALAELAEEKASSSEVKDFARTMKEEHRQIVSKLSPLAGPYAQQLQKAKTENRRNEAGKEGQQGQAGQKGQAGQAQDREQGQNQPRQGNQPGHGRAVHGGRLDAAALKMELGEECLTTIRKELQSKEGTDFDKCYMMQQVAAHLEMLDTLQVFHRYAQGDLKNLIEEGAETTKKHLKHARELAQETDTLAHKSSDKRRE